MPEINFFAEDVKLPAYLNEEETKNCLLEIAHNFDVTIEVLNYIFCSDDYLLEMNREYLDHNFYTDVITFPYQQNEIIEGDIFISIDRIEENAEIFGQSKEREFYRVISHGMLHLIGFNDKTNEDALLMKKEEEEALLYFQKRGLC